jgi:non-specific serine/threonine protein kinase/serine/threonine-protein kinase
LVEILGEAMSRPPSERDAFLERACAGDAALLAEARSLLKEANATSFEAVTAKLGARVGRAASDLKQLPKQIGPYQILGLLGEGGMGVVYHAEQTSPIRREVALKLARTGLRGESARARFDAERQALAVMDHPNIARIYDAGAIDDGVPYFAMELVRGDPITSYCDAQHMDVDARVVLFSKVCRAVQHAHVKGVIHRDLKPSNILVSVIDGAAEPRVIDFGIAKAIAATADTETMHTAFGSVIGTLEYMSPEQAGGQAVDTRSDVYSLGVILYELVTGALPFESAALRKAGPAEAQRLIRDTDPPTPVRRFSETPTRESVAKARSTDARSLEKYLRDDLGWIVLKAIEKDPARRYQSASDFAADLDRLRAHQPVDAGPPSRRYRASRFVRRHRTGVVAGSAVLVALLAGITLATTGFVRAKRAQERAEVEAVRAKRSRDFLTTMLAQARPDEEGPEVTMMTVVDSAAAYMARDTTFRDDPLARADILHALGETYRTYDQYDRAIPLFQEALALKRGAAGDNDRTTLVTLNKLSQSQAMSGDLKSGIVTQEQVVALSEKTIGKENAEYSARLSNLGNMYADAGELAKAEAILRESLTIDRRVLGSDNEEMPVSINNLATILVDQGKCADAIPLHEESLALRKRFYGEPSSDVALALGNYARALDCAGRFAEAEVFADSAVAMCATTFGPDHVRTATARVRLAEVYVHTERAEQAEPLLRGAITIYRGINERLWRVGDAQARLGEVQLALGRDQEGIDDVTTGWEILTETTGPNTLRAREIASIAARYYAQRSDRVLAERWGARAGGNP